MGRKANGQEDKGNFIIIMKWRWWVYIKRTAGDNIKREEKRASARPEIDRNSDIWREGETYTEGELGTRRSRLDWAMFIDKSG